MLQRSRGTIRAGLVLAATLGACDDSGNAQSNDYAPSEEKGDIFGKDGRVERYKLETDDPRYEFARSSAALVRGGDVLTPSPQGAWSVEAPTLGQLENLCEGEKFAEQLTPAWCSATLVAADLVLTAGHCLTSQEDLEASSAPVRAACSETKVVFDFAYDSRDADLSEIPAANVYQCIEVVAHEYFKSRAPSADYAILKLDRPVLDRTPVGVRDGGTHVRVGAAVTQIGHPSGIPQKIVDSVVTEAVPCQSFGYVGASFPGNSGGGVFDLNTGTVAGVTTRNPGVHYRPDGARGCNVAAVCEEHDDCTVPWTTAYGTSAMLPRLTPFVREKLRIVENGGPSGCGEPEGSVDTGDDDDALDSCEAHCWDLSLPVFATFECLDACEASPECVENCAGGSWNSRVPCILACGS